MKNPKDPIKNARSEYQLHLLTEDDVPDNPLSLVKKWLHEAVASGIRDANAMVFSTVSQSLVPTSRIVLIRDLTDSSLVFFTNYESAKGEHIESRPHVSGLFFWREFERQIRLEGKIEKTSSLVSQEYFSTRPRASQIGAWASPQSKTIDGRHSLESLFKQAERKFEGVANIPCPPFWGGYVFSPQRIEFWQGRESRLHDRLVCEMSSTQGWIKSRLAP